MVRLNALVVGLRDFSALPLQDALLVLTIWSTYLMPVVVSGVAVSRITGLLLVLVCSQTVSSRTSREATAVFLLFFAILLLSSISAGFVGYQARFPFEAIKTIIVFAVTFFVGLSLSAARIRALLEPSPWLFLILVTGVFLFVGNPFGIDGRLQIEGFISSNVLGFLSVLNIAVLLSRPKLHALDYATLIALIVVTGLCLSRSAMLAGLALLWVRIGWLRGAVVFGGVGAAMGLAFSGSKLIERMLVVEDVLTTGGSGRATLWSFLGNNWLHTPSTWLFGFGPGAVHRHPVWRATQDAAHSIVIGSIYYWGIAGFLFVIGTFMLAVREIIKIPASPERNLARDILLIMLANGLVGRIVRCLASQRNFGRIFCPCTRCDCRSATSTCKQCW